MCVIRLTRRKVAKVDGDVVAELSQHMWYAHKRGYSGKFYAQRRVCGGASAKMVSMAYEVWRLNGMGPVPEGMVLDHINRDSLDNRLANLRLATNRQNSANIAAARGGTSRYKGVCWRKSTGRWVAQGAGGAVEGGKGRKRKWIGSFAREGEAARAYDRWVLQYGEAEFAYLNFAQELGQRMGEIEDGGGEGEAARRLVGMGAN